MKPALAAVFIGMTIVTFLTRSLFTVMVARVRTGPFLEKVLYSIPLATLTALVVPPLLSPGRAGISLANNPYLLAGALTFVVSFFTRNLFLSVLCGIGLFLVLLHYLPL